MMEVEPWEPNSETSEVIERLLERQFLLSPWVREKRLRNQLRLVLKDVLEAGPRRRSTVTKIVHDAHQLYPIWRNQIRETMFNNWEKVQELEHDKAGEVIFAQFKKTRFPDEAESIMLYAEHMVEVGQYLKRKAAVRAEKCGKAVYTPNAVTNSKFWYEVRKKIAEVQEEKRSTVRRTSSSLLDDDDDSDDEAPNDAKKKNAISEDDDPDTESDEKEKLVKQNSRDSNEKLVKQNSRDSNGF